MAFKFGGVRESLKPKDLLASSKAQEALIENHFIENSSHYFLVLLDKFPRIDQLKSLQKLLQKCGIISYIMISAVDVQYKLEDLKGEGITDFIKTHRSNWRNYLDFKGMHCEAIICFGAALYSINNCADLQASDFYENLLGRPYYYMGHANFKYDTYVYPVDNLDGCWPLLDEKHSSMPNTNFKTRFCEAQLKDAVRGRHHEWKPDLRERKKVICKSREECDQVFKDNMNAELVAFDTETNGFLFYKNKIHCFTVCWDGITGYFMPWRFVNKRLLVQNLMSCKRRTGANPKFDLKFMWFDGVSKQLTVTDALDRLSHVLFSNRVVGLKPLSYLYTSFGGYDLPLDVYKKRTKCADYSTIPDDTLAPYATDDAIAAWQVQVELDKQCDWIDKHFPNEKFEDWTMKRWYETQMMPIYRDICEVEYRGIYVNSELADKYRKEMKSLIKPKVDKILNMWNLPSTFNLMSNVELGKMFEKWGWNCHGRTKDGVYMTDEDAMLAWKREGKPGIGELLELRSLQSILNSFLGQTDESGKKTGWLQYMYDRPDGTCTIQQSYIVMGTESFRFVGVNPNFQNLPAHNSWAPYVKKTITTPPEDLYVIESDSGTEYRVAPFEYLLTQDGYKQAQDLLETDAIIEDSDKPPVLRCTFEKQNDGSYIKPSSYWFHDEEISA